MWALIISLVLAAPPPLEARVAYERGRRMWELGDDMAGARAALDEAVRLAPDYGQAYLTRAMVVEHDRGYAPARADYERAQELDPGNKEVWREHAQALVGAGDRVRAEAFYLVAVALDPAYGDAWYGLGRLYRKSGRLGEAVRAFEHDAALTPKGAAHHELGEIFLELGDDARAEKEFERDLVVDETCYESRANLAGLAFERGEIDKAREQYEQSLLYHPADARALSGLGRAYLALGDLERAVGTLRAAADLAPTDARVADALTDARRRLRWRLGWPFAVAPAAVALALVGLMLRMRKRSPERPT